MMKKIPFELIKLTNAILVSIPFMFVWFTYYEPRTMTVTSKKVTTLMLLIYLLIFYYLSMKLDGFRVSIKRLGELVLSQMIAVGVTDVVAAVLIWMLSIRFPNLLPGFACFLAQVAVIFLFCLASYIMYFKANAPEKSIVIYDARQGMEALVTSYGLDRRYNIKTSYAIEEVVNADLTAEEQQAKLDKLLGNCEDLFLCGIRTHERNILLKYSIHNDKRVYMIPRVSDVILSSAEKMHMFHLPFLKVMRYNPPFAFRFLKRTIDIVVSGLALLLFSPIFAVVAIMVKTDGGPALYKQVRLTKDGKQFKILKFRSMRVDAEKFSGAVLSSGENDPRITKVGRIIRACRLDELPQLWNIFVGDMSIVGPRPERPELAAVFEKDMPEFALRLQCKAGLTGYAQVYGKYNTTPYDKLLMDLMYIAHPSLSEDLIIMLATIKILFSKESTEGVGEQTTELKYMVREKA